MMERRMSVRDVLEDVERVVQSVQDDNLVIIEQKGGPDLVLMTRAAFERMQAGQRNPDVARTQRSAGQRNPDAVDPKKSAGQRNPD